MVSHRFFTVVTVVVCMINCGLFVLAANEEPVATVTPSKGASPETTAQPTPSSVSPDKKWEYKSATNRKPQIVKAGTDEAAGELSCDISTCGDGGLQGKVIWSQDSKWFAYALMLGQRVTETRVCHRSGDRFEALKTEHLGVDPGGDVRNEYVTPLRWVKPGTLVLEQFSIFRGGAGDAKIQFTVRFDEHGKFHVIGKKKIQDGD